jgi:hypothetical protein
MNFAHPLGDLQADGRPAVHPGESGGVLEGAAHAGHVAEGDDPIAADLHRQAQHVLRALEQAGHLDREAALAGIQGAGGHQAVVALDEADEFLVADAVTVQHQRVDDYLHRLDAIAVAHEALADSDDAGRIGQSGHPQALCVAADDVDGVKMDHPAASSTVFTPSRPSSSSARRADERRWAFSVRTGMRSSAVVPASER